MSSVVSPQRGPRGPLERPALAVAGDVLADAWARLRDRVRVLAAGFWAFLVREIPELASWQLAHPWRALRHDRRRYGVRGRAALRAATAGIAVIVAVGVVVGVTLGAGVALASDLFLALVRGPH